jgi:hypothetical protein
MITIGKLAIDKSKIKITIGDFIKSANSLIDNDVLSDVLDIAEYRLCIKMLNSLKNDRILRRCLVKDATASFFQNLMRILGAKDQT